MNVRSILSRRRQQKQDEARHQAFLAHNYARQGWLDEAEGAYQKALRLSPKDATIHYDYANLLDDLDRLREAVHHYRRALSLNPYFDTAHHNYALVLEKLGQPDEAEREYRRAVAISPAYFEARYNLAMLLEGQCHYFEAEVEYRTLVRQFPHKTIFRAALANVLGYHLGRVYEAKEQVSIARSLDPFDQCIAELAKHLDSYYTSPDTRQHVARIQRAEKQRRAKEEGQKRRRELAELMAALEKDQPISETSPSLEQVSDPDVAALVANGFVANHQGRPGEALKLFQTAQTILRQRGQFDAAARLSEDIGIALEAINRCDEALEYYKQAEIARFKSDDEFNLARLWYNMSGLYIQVGELSEALDYLRAAQSAFRRHQDELRVARVDAMIGLVYLRQGQLAQAERSLRMALKVFRAHNAVYRVALVNVHLAQIEHSVGHWNKAAELYLSVRDEFLGVGDLLKAAGAEYNFGLACIKERLWHQALHQFRSAVLRFEQARVAIPIGEDRVTFFADKLNAYRRIISILKARQDPEDGREALECVERAKGRWLLDQLSHASLRIPTNLPTHLVAREEELLSTLDQLSGTLPQAARAIDPSIGATLYRIRDELADIYDELEGYAPDYVNLRRGTPISFSELKAILAQKSSVSRRKTGQPRG
jgi:tetratricopeptide (TPR) repeat protein